MKCKVDKKTIYVIDKVEKTSRRLTICIKSKMTDVGCTMGWMTVCFRCTEQYASALFTQDTHFITCGPLLSERL